jgi:hypothetical protein
MSDIGSDASAAGYPLVPNTGEEGRVRFGAREINRTRDFIAQLKNLFGGYGTALPDNSDGKPDGTIYNRII